MSGRPTVAIIGAGFAGLGLARRLRKAPVDVVVLDQHNHHLFQPLLYQVATGVLSPGEIAPSLRSVLRRQRNTRVVMGEVTDTDLEGRTLTVRAVGGQEEQLHWDYLVAAPGAVSSYFGHDEWAPHLHTMKSIEGALALRNQVLSSWEIAAVATDPEDRARQMTFAIVGAGPTGVELAGELAALSREMSSEYHGRSLRPRIVLIDGGSAVLGSFPAKLQRAAAKRLGELGVEIMLGQRAVGVDAGGIDMEDADKARRRIDARTVVWAAGVATAPIATQIGRAAGAEVDRKGRVTVGSDCSVAGHPDVFVIGDAANQRDLPGLCEPAMQEGWYVAKVIEHRVAGSPPPGDFTYRDLGTMATVGPRSAVADAFGIQLSGILGKVAWGAVHIAFLVGWGNRVGVLARWTWDAATRKQSERVIVGSTGEAVQPAT